MTLSKELRLRLEPVADNGDALLSIRWPATCLHKSYTNGQKGRDQKLIDCGHVSSRDLPLRGWVWRRFCCELTAVVSLLCYFLCVITILTAVAGVMIGLFKSERVHYYPRPVVERNVTAANREPRLFMVVPETKPGSPAKNIEANSAAVPTETADAKKSQPHKHKVLAPHDVYGNTLVRPEESPNRPGSLFSTGDPDWR